MYFVVVPAKFSYFSDCMFFLRLSSKDFQAKDSNLFEAFRADMDLIVSHRNQMRMLNIEFCRHYFIRLVTSVNAFLVLLILSQAYQ